MSPTAEEIRQQFAVAPMAAVPLMTPPAPVQARPRVTIEQVVQTVSEDVVVRPLRPAVDKTHLVSADEKWTWQELRDYVVGEILNRFGVFPRDEKKERGIFSSFVTRYPGQAAAIAKYAFEFKGGYWKGAPISVTRFCKGSDPYFADPIKSTLDNIATQ